MEILLLIALLIGAAYLITTGATWVVLWLVEAAFGWHLDTNIWALGGIVFIALWVLKSIFGGK